MPLFSAKFLLNVPGYLMFQNLNINAEINFIVLFSYKTEIFSET